MKQQDSCNLMLQIKTSIEKLPIHLAIFLHKQKIPGSIELLENFLTFEGVQWRKIKQCIKVLSTLSNTLHFIYWRKYITKPLGAYSV